MVSIEEMDSIALPLEKRYHSLRENASTQKWTRPSLLYRTSRRGVRVGLIHLTWTPQRGITSGPISHGSMVVAFVQQPLTFALVALLLK